MHIEASMPEPIPSCSLSAVVVPQSLEHVSALCQEALPIHTTPAEQGGSAQVQRPLSDCANCRPGDQLKSTKAGWPVGQQEGKRKGLKLRGEKKMELHT